MNPTKRPLQEEKHRAWDPTPGIVSVWADGNGDATVWRRLPDSGVLVRETARYQPWMLLDRLDDLRHLGKELARDGASNVNGARVIYRELQGPGELRYHVRARSEEHTSELQSRLHLVCRLLLEKKNHQPT